MLEFKKIELEDRAWVAKAFSHAENINCEYTFSTIYMWAQTYKTVIARYEDFAICRWGRNDHILYSVPVGTGNFRAAVEEILKDAEKENFVPRIFGASGAYKELLEKYFSGKFTYENDDSTSDYIYNASDLANLSGKKYHGKRNHIANFEKNNPSWQYEELNSENINECIELHKFWIKEKDEEDEDYQNELEATLLALDNFDYLGLKGGLIRVNAVPVAYTFGERLNDECFDSHIEKALPAIQGSYAVINREFARRLYDEGYKYINREEDLGIPGLRRAKQSYHPAIWLKKEIAVYRG